MFFGHFVTALLTTPIRIIYGENPCNATNSPSFFQFISRGMVDSTRSSLVALMDSVKDSWLESLLLNVAIYLVLVIPAWMFIRYYRKIAQGGVTPTGVYKMNIDLLSG